MRAGNLTHARSARQQIILPMSWDTKTRELFMERYEERAAIKEFMGNMPRAEAEREAEIEVKAEMHRETKAKAAGLFA
jgi:hypothetical protein